MGKQYVWTYKLIYLAGSDYLIAETSNSFPVSEITDSATFPGIPAISDLPSTETTDSVFSPVIADSQAEITPKSYWSNWIECVATLSCIGNDTNEYQTLVNDARNSDIPNIEQWIKQAKNTITQIQENCGRFIQKHETILQDI